MSKSSRDDFKKSTVELLAKRAGHKCSNPSCRNPTSGPAASKGTANLGVAAHITAAAPGGSRFDKSLTRDQRCAPENGIWLCQQCSRLIDVDESEYSVELLLEWKSIAEATAFLELRGYGVALNRSFSRLEEKLPDLVSEMRSDLKVNPLTREIIALSKKWSYNSGDKPFFVYYFEDHPELLSKLQICENYGAVYDVSYNDVERYNFSEEFVDYLIQKQ